MVWPMRISVAVMPRGVWAVEEIVGNTNTAATPRPAKRLIKLIPFPSFLNSPTTTSYSMLRRFPNNVTRFHGDEENQPARLMQALIAELSGCVLLTPA